MEETTDTSMTDPADSGRRRTVLLVIGLVLVLSQVGPGGMLMRAKHGSSGMGAR